MRSKIKNRESRSPLRLDFDSIRQRLTPLPTIHSLKVSSHHSVFPFISSFLSFSNYLNFSLHRPEVYEKIFVKSLVSVAEHCPRQLGH